MTHRELKNMLDMSNPAFNQKDRIREVLQNITLYGLSTAGFFSKSAFYGGTALRIFHDLDRLSEDLDFSLKSPDPDFSFDGYLPDLEKVLTSFDLDLEISVRKKTSESTIKSAFLKGNTRELLLEMYPGSGLSDNVTSTEVTKIKFEVDIDPPPYAKFETKVSLNPYLFSVDLYDLPSLFAGKLHAVLCRKWRDRVKGRDFYDFLYYMSRNVPVNMRHLEARLRQTGCIDSETVFDIGCLRDMLKDRFAAIDFEEAKKDVMNFVYDRVSLNGWDSKSFILLADKVQGI